MATQSLEGIVFRVVPDFVHSNSGPFNLHPLLVRPEELILAIESVRTPPFRNPSFTIDYYLRTTLLALDYGTGFGQDFKLDIERENHDLRRVIAESFGVAAGALLLDRDLGVSWPTLVQIYSRHLLAPRSRWGRRRPDLMTETTQGTTLLECKGTTSSASASGMLSSAYGQVKHARLRNGDIRNRCIACTFVPLSDDSQRPTIWAGDPDEKSHHEPSMLIDEIIVKKALWLHYGHIANMAGLERLAAFLHQRTFERGEFTVSEEDVNREFAQAEENSIELFGKRLYARTIAIPIASSRIPSGLICPRYLVSLGLEAGIARSLVRGSIEEVEHELRKLRSVREPMRLLLSDGSGIQLKALHDEGALNPYQWWSPKKES